MSSKPSSSAAGAEKGHTMNVRSSSSRLSALERFATSFPAETSEHYKKNPTAT